MKSFPGQLPPNPTIYDGSGHHRRRCRLHRSLRHCRKKCKQQHKIGGDKLAATTATQRLRSANAVAPIFNVTLVQTARTRGCDKGGYVAGGDGFKRIVFTRSCGDGKSKTGKVVEINSMTYQPVPTRDPSDRACDLYYHHRQQRRHNVSLSSPPKPPPLSKQRQRQQQHSHSTHRSDDIDAAATFVDPVPTHAAKSDDASAATIPHRCQHHRSVAATVMVPNTENANIATNVNNNNNVATNSTIAVDVDQIILGKSDNVAALPPRNVTNVGVQTSALMPYRLRFWPGCCNKDTLPALFDISRQGSACPDEDSGTDGCQRCTQIARCTLRVLSQWFLSQLGLTVVLTMWALLGAWTFHKTEGPRELEQSENLLQLRHDLSIDLATDLRQIATSHAATNYYTDLPPDEADKWPAVIQRFYGKYENALLQAVSAGYGEGGNNGRIWTYPGCLLFAVSLLTTLGFGAPVPRTPLARGAAVFFSAIGIPLHFLLIINVGTMMANFLQQCTRRKQRRRNKMPPKVPTIDGAMQNGGPNSIAVAQIECPDESFGTDSSKYNEMTLWLKWFPVLAIVFYYCLGVSAFGIARSRSLVDSLMFPLDFTAAGGVAGTSGHVRILYALYLEVAVTLAAVIVSLVQASATRGVIDLGLRLGLLTNN